MANYYDGQPMEMYNGLFDFYGVPQKPFYAMKAFNELYKAGIAVPVCQSQEQSSIYACAARTPVMENAFLLLANPGRGDVDVTVYIKGLDPESEYQEETRILDKDRDLEQISTAGFSGEPNRGGGGDRYRDDHWAVISFPCPFKTMVGSRKLVKFKDILLPGQL